MRLGRLIRQESVRGFVARLIAAIGLPVATGVAILAIAFLWRQASPLGFQVDYFAAWGESKPIASRTCRKAMVYYAEGPPALGVPREDYFAVWRGFLLVPTTALYEFDSFSDDGIRVYIDNLLLIDNWRSRGWKGSGVGAGIDLDAGSHPIRIEHRNRGGPSGLVLHWQGGDIAAGTIVATPYIVKRPL